VDDGIGPITPLDDGTGPTTPFDGTIPIIPVVDDTSPADTGGDDGDPDSTLSLEGATVEFPAEGDVMVIREDGDVISAAFFGNRTGSGDDIQVTITGFSIDIGEGIALISTDDQGWPREVALPAGGLVTFDFDEDGTFSYSFSVDGQVLVTGSGLVPAEYADPAFKARSLAKELTPLELQLCAAVTLDDAAFRACKLRHLGFSQEAVFPADIRGTSQYLEFAMVLCTLFNDTLPKLKAAWQRCCQGENDGTCAPHVCGTVGPAKLHVENTIDGIGVVVKRIARQRLESLVNSNPGSSAEQLCTEPGDAQGGCCFRDTAGCIGPLTADWCTLKGGDPVPSCTPDPCTFACCVPEEGCRDDLSADACGDEFGTMHARGTTCATIGCAVSSEDFPRVYRGSGTHKITVTSSFVDGGSIVSTMPINVEVTLLENGDVEGTVSGTDDSGGAQNTHIVEVVCPEGTDFAGETKELYRLTLLPPTWRGTWRADDSSWDMEWAIVAFDLPLAGHFSSNSIGGEGTWPPTLVYPRVPDDVGAEHESSVCMSVHTTSYVIIDVEFTAGR
jgi:hypothetical protein